MPIQGDTMITMEQHQEATSLLMASFIECLVLNGVDDGLIQGAIALMENRLEQSIEKIKEESANDE
jgi:hypothetical protein